MSPYGLLMHSLRVVPFNEKGHLILIVVETLSSGVALGVIVAV